MATDKTLKHPELVECEICLKEVPSSGTQSEEASDYVMYFCGLECFDKWRNHQEHESDNKE